MAAYKDKFQAYIVELKTSVTMNYNDFRIKTMLVSNFENAEGISHLIQKCRYDENMTYAMCAAYLRKSAIVIYHANALKPLRLMHVLDHTE